ncbi:MAG: hypothetical protein UV94_C0038G0004 [Parcubacteria group bacterium GW2011_GWC1_43_30]|nr:MAG: hypothetical protein UV94_C0038G0004 [Parcubacteria group bacterium GW2011_GWC1_43_30]
MNYDLKQFLREHKLAVFLALLTSTIVAFPQVYFRIDHKELYQEGTQVIEMLPHGPWEGRVREVQDGHVLGGNVYQKEGKDNPYIYQPLAPMVVAYMGKIFALDINNTILLSRLVLPFVVFLLIYGFVFLVSRDKFTALSSAAVLLLADSILSYSGITRLLQGVSPDHFLRLARPVVPALIYLFLFAFLLFFWQFYRKGNWKYGALSIIVLGLNFYNYFYTWTYLYAFGSILILLLIIQRNWRQVLRIGSVFVGGAIVAIPYFINMYRASQFPTFEDMGISSGIILSHQPLFMGSSIIIALLFFLFLFPRIDKEKYLFGLAILLTPFLTMNQQVLTGRIMQPDHYHWFFHKPLAVSFVLITIFYLFDRRHLDLYKKIFAILVITSSIATGPVMDWLNSNAKKEAQIFGNDATADMTVLYTSLNVLYHAGICCTSISVTKSTLYETLFIFFRLNEVDAQSAYEAFSRERAFVSRHIFGIYYRKLNGSYESIPDEKFDEIVGMYKETLSTPTSKWLEQIFEKYEVEYIVWDKVANPQWQLESYPFLKEVAMFDSMAIYQIYR